MFRFESEHKLKMVQWNFVYGSKKVTADGEVKVQNVSAPVYPPKPILNYALLPSLDLTLAQATGAIMKNPSAKPTQQYIALWKQCKAEGKIPTPGDKGSQAEVTITENSTLREILEFMAQLATAAEECGKIDSKAISSLAGRKLWVIPSAETPMFKDVETMDDIDHVASIKIDMV